MMRLPALDLVSDAVSHGAVIDRSIHESISLHDMILNRDTPNAVNLACDKKCGIIQSPAGYFSTFWLAGFFPTFWLAG